MKGYLDENEFLRFRLFPKVLFRKLPDHNYAKVSAPNFSPAITSHNDNSIFKYTLQLKIFRSWIKICTNSFIKKISKHHGTKIITRKKIRRRTKIDDILNIIHFFFSQTNLLLKSNPIFLDILDSFCHSVFICIFTF